ncbi:hypothetical protein SADUNF_Sadunf18G0035600 [Salix dunnii]|uniref:Uncharacterized protein n=1 Tax=Salix dunnii TaxID=1413687 RepID=A0A835MDI5_9ROSI|nr:hypothetical protein SADUNF_Sadunf18G0035600 [Salix dunnii]
MGYEECKTLENGDEDSMLGVTKTIRCIFLRERDPPLCSSSHFVTPSMCSYSSFHLFPLGRESKIIVKSPDKRIHEFCFYMQGKKRVKEWIQPQCMHAKTIESCVDMCFLDILAASDQRG